MTWFRGSGEGIQRSRQLAGDGGKGGAVRSGGAAGDALPVSSSLDYTDAEITHLKGLLPETRGAAWQRSMDEVEAEGRRMVHGPTMINYHDFPIDPRIARRFNGALANLSERYPTAFSRRIHVVAPIPEGNFRDLYGPGEMAYDFGRRAVAINRTSFLDHDIAMRIHEANVQARFHPPPADPARLLYHEFAHGGYLDITHKSSATLRDTLAATRDLQRRIRKVIPHYQSVRHAKFSGQIADALSVYATDSEGEMLGDGLMEYLSSRNPRPLAREIGGWYDHWRGWQ